MIPDECHYERLVSRPGQGALGRGARRAGHSWVINCEAGGRGPAAISGCALVGNPEPRPRSLSAGWFRPLQMSAPELAAAKRRGSAAPLSQRHQLGIPTVSSVLNPDARLHRQSITDIIRSYLARVLTPEMGC